MNKEEFLAALAGRINALPQEDVQRSLDYYAEMIDDRMEDGMNEEEAVASLGDIDAIGDDILSSLPLTTIVRQRVRDSRERSEKSGHSAAWIALAVLGFPLWFPLLMVLAALVLTVYIMIWAVIVSLFAVLLALAVTGLAALIYGVVKLAALGLSATLMVLGTAAALLGIALLLWEPVLALAKLLTKLTGRFWRWVKRQFLGWGGDER